MELYDNSTILVPTPNTSTFDTFPTVAPDVEPTRGTSVSGKCAILGPTSNISILDNSAIGIMNEINSTLVNCSL